MNSDSFQRLLTSDFSQAERQRIAGELVALLDDMTAHGRERSDPMREVFARTGDRWSVLLLLLLRIGAFRHATLRRLVSATSAEGEISQRMLTLRLRALERDGFISRSVSDDVPPRVDYAITPLGRSFLVELEGLMNWVRKNNQLILASRARFDSADSPLPM